MGYFVKCLCKVKKDSVSLYVIVQVSVQIMNEKGKLGFTGKIFSKSMLCGMKKVIRVQEVHDFGVNDVLHELARHAC